ncbi:MAG: hypothetical protein V3U27_10815 [Candidatus Tectomicrobia bacterium]
MSEATTESSVSHDELIERIAAHAIDATIFTVYTNTQRLQTRSVKGQYPHIVGLGKTSQLVEFVGMVETAERLHDLAAAARRWHTLEPLQAAMYLYVQKGYCADARTLCLRETIRISDFRHYWFDEDGQLHVEKCFA